MQEKEMISQNMAFGLRNTEAERKRKEEEKDLWRLKFGKNPEEQDAVQKKWDKRKKAEKAVVFDFKRFEKFYLSRLIAVEAYSFLKEWMTLKFPASLSGQIGQKSLEFFRWIDEEGVLGKLEDRVDGFKTSERTNEFMGYVKEAHSSLEKKPPSVEEVGGDFEEKPAVEPEISGPGAKKKIDWDVLNGKVDLKKLNKKYGTLEKTRGSIELWEALGLMKKEWPGNSASDNDWQSKSGYSQRKYQK